MHSLVHKSGLAGVAATLLIAGACQTLNTKKEQGAVIGATGGAVVGGVIGHATGSTARGAIIGHQMDQKAKEIQAKVPGAIVTREGEGLVVTFASGLLFDFDSERLRAESRRNLDSLATSLASFGDSKLLLVGHTDSVGTASYNLDLSQRRAGAVADYLIARGVPAARLATSGRGETDPVAPNDTDADRQLNRRVEVVVTAGDKMKAQAKAQAGSGS